ncbi:MAG: type II secretion system F family protein [Candidatus Babeliaceae bacterium]|nr:type II secretion system F family protein [Candidatus Babeliaceae bacterium]
MPYYKWFGYDARQTPNVGYLACERQSAALILLQKRDIACIYVIEVRHNFFRPCGFSDRQAVLYELSQLLEAQVRLTQALEIISSLVKKEYIRQVLLDCMRAVQEGKSFADAAERYPELFDPLTIHAIKAGHDSGLLAHACIGRSKQLVQLAEIRTKIAAAIAMPLITVTFFIVILLFLITIILPQFKRIFSMLKAAIPPSTQFLFDIADSITFANITIFITLLCMTIIGLITFLKTTIGRKVYDNFLLYFPGLSSIYQDLARAQCLQSLSLLIHSGRTLADALIRVAESFNNSVIHQQLLQIHHNVQIGKPFTQAIEVCPLLSIAEIRNCLAIAQETAELAIILQQLSAISRARALKKLDLLTLFIQPTLLVFLGAAIGGVLLALYVPLLQIPQIIS